MNIEIREEPHGHLAEHARVPIAFQVDRLLDPTPDEDRPGSWRLQERPVHPPYVKDYDSIARNRPLDWPGRFDMSSWGLFAAWFEGRLLGGAVVAFKTASVDLLEGRIDLAVLWDLRVLPQMRGYGIGSRLFEAVERWAAERGCRQLKIETQNVNVTACRFYAAQGCRLGSVHAGAYPTLPDEIQLIWWKDLGQPAA